MQTEQNFLLTFNFKFRITETQGAIPDKVLSLAPTSSNSSAGRVDVASDFSFAVCDMLAAPYVDMQLLLESPTLGRRLKHLKKLLLTTKQYLVNHEKKIDKTQD